MGAMQYMDRAEHDTRGSSNRVSRESRDGGRGGRRWFVGVEEESCRSRDLAMFATVYSIPIPMRHVM